MSTRSREETSSSLGFHGGDLGALLPFFIFIGGVMAIALSGAPDERGFWPILVLALAAGLVLAKNRRAYSEAVIEGMSQKIVMIMITAWLLASTLGVLMSVTGLVEGLSWLATWLNLGSRGMLIATFSICSIVAVSTGSSFATILICGPILYPAGGLVGTDLPLLAGAVIAGATFGDCIAPISDTTIASATSQHADIGGTVKSRLKYVLPAGALALFGFLIFPMDHIDIDRGAMDTITRDSKGLIMIIVPVLIIYLFLKGKHLLHGLLAGIGLGVLIGLTAGLLQPEQLITLDLENFTAQSFVIDGMNRAVGISFFTILLMGLVGSLQASGLLHKLVAEATQRSANAKQAELWIAASATAAVLLTTHSVVSILMVGEFAHKSGEAKGVYKYRRANILSLIVCIFPFLLPYFIPVILMANTTQSGSEFGLDVVAPLQVGLYNFVSWGLLLMTIAALFMGYGRKRN